MLPTWQRPCTGREIKNTSPDLNSEPAGDIPLQFRKPLTLHLGAWRVEALAWLSVHSALHLRDTAIMDGRTGLGAPHVKPMVRPSISLLSQRDKALQAGVLASCPATAIFAGRGRMRVLGALLQDLIFRGAGRPI